MSVTTNGPLFNPGTRIDRAIKAAAQETARYALPRLRAESRYRTGRMAGGWDVWTKANGLRWSNDVPYTIYHELGTTRMRPKPMVGVVLPEAQSYFVAKLSEHIGTALAAEVTSGVWQPTGYQNMPDRSRPYHGGLQRSLGSRVSGLGNKVKPGKAQRKLGKI